MNIIEQPLDLANIVDSEVPIFLQYLFSEAFAIARVVEAVANILNFCR